MKYSAVAALCAVPLVLAGSVDMGFVQRRNEVVVASSSSEAETVQQQSQKGNKKESSSDIATLITQSSTTEIIIIWANAGGDAATTTMNQPASTQGQALATHTVTVGGAAGLVYTPSSVTAAVGDMVLFEFQSQNHTVTQSGFTTPCDAMAGGFDTGFSVANPNNTVSPPPQMALQVNVATPMWFYCRQKGHCGKGMVFSINPTANKTQAMFEQQAIALNGTGATGGAASSVATTAVASATAAAGASSVASSAAVATTTTATGTTNANGACECACLCGTAAFPSDVQGLFNFGGMSGAMPASALEIPPA